MNKGKEFEAVFKQNWKESMPNSFLYRLKDQVSGYKITSKNISDFIGYKYPNEYIIECKSHNGASFPLSNLSQLDLMLDIAHENIFGLRIGVVLWLVDKKSVTYWPITTIEKLKNDGFKSINPEKIDSEKYFFVTIPSVTKKVYPKSDYSILTKLEEGQ